MADLPRLARSLSALKGRTIITFHSLGDADAVCSALVLKALIGKGAQVRKLDTLTAHARHVLGRLDIPEPPALTGLDCDNLVLVDVSTPILLAGWAKRVHDFKGNKIVIDHHSHNTPIKVDCYYNDPAQPSTGEIIYALAARMRHRLTEKEALLLLTSVLRDTAMLKSASSSTFTVVASLLARTKWPFPKVRGLAEGKMDVSERLANLRAAQRATLYRADEMVIVTSTVNAFELSAATALIGAGADVAFVANERLGRVSGVKRESLPNVDISHVMEKAGVFLKGSGGGHKNVGGAQGDVRLLGASLELCVRLAAEQAAATRVKKL